MNNMRSVKEKEEIVNFYLSGHGLAETKKKYNIEYDSVFYRWLKKYQENGVEGLKSSTGKNKGGNKGLHLRKPKSRIEELELELMKKEIEIARLKKGYMVKGVGAEKEFVTTFDKNIK
jgi:transposase-like protein